MKASLRRPPVWASILTVVGIIVLCALGVWQIQRLHWKENILAQVDTAWSLPPVDITTIGDAPMVRVKADGQYGTRFFYITSRTYKGQVGLFVIAPLRLDNGKIVLVNRGWTPPDIGDDQTHGTLASVTGIFHAGGEKANRFTPENDPQKDLWYRIDPHDMAIALNVDETSILNGVLVEENGDPARVLPVPVGAQPHMNNNHLSYALFWFSMAAALLCIFFLRFMRD